MPQLIDERQYDPITPYPVPDAEEMARLQLERIAREKEIKRRRDELLEQSRREAFGEKPRDTVMINGVETPLKEAFDRIPAQMEFEERLQSSPLRQRALARTRIEELIADGVDPDKAAEQAKKEQEGRSAAYRKGQEAVRSEGSNVDKEVRSFAESTVNSIAPIARLLGQRQMADEAEARTAGGQAEMARHRDENYGHPEIAGAVAGAAQNVAQMGIGIAGSMVAGPKAGMAIMAGQFGSQEYSRAAYDGAEAGLAGGELQLYAGIQGGIEASIMPIMSKIPGMAGIEGRVIRQSLARRIASNPTVLKAIQGGKTLTKDIAAELVEEELTEVLHGVTTEKLLDQDVDYKAVIKDTAL